MGRGERSEGIWRARGEKVIQAIAIIAEERIRQAQEKGELDNLPGAGRPLDLADDANIPDELKMAYRLLKNGGYLDDVSLREGDVETLRDLMPKASDEGAKLRQMLTLQVVEARFKNQTGRDLRVADDDPYYEKVVNAVATHGRKEK